MPTSPNANRAYPGFELKRLLGVGATAEVFAAMNLSRQLLVAISKSTDISAAERAFVSANALALKSRALVPV